MIDSQKCVLIIDDEVKMTRALTDFFKANNYFVLEAHDGESALSIFYEYGNQIDIILLDVMLPKVDGFSVLEEIRSASPFLPVIMLTAKTEECDQLRGFAKGADDYVTKPFSPTLLLARTEAALRRFGKQTQREISIGEIIIRPMERTVVLDSEILELTRREYDLLYFLVINKSLPFTREQLLNHVWGYDFEGSLRTVDTHIRQLRAKFGKYADYIKTIHCVGYQFEV